MNQETKYSFTLEQFVRTWMAAVKYSHDGTWIGEQLGIEARKATNMASTLRERGIKLPRLPRNNRAWKYTPLTVKKINEIIEEELNEDVKDYDD